MTPKRISEAEWFAIAGTAAVCAFAVALAVWG